MGTTAGMLAAGRSDLGYREGPDNDTKFGDWYGLPHQPWCDMAVSYWAAKSGNGPAVGKFAWTPAHAHWFAQQGRLNRQPHPGDIVFFAWSGSTSIDAIDHVGIVEAVRDDGSVITIEGNSGDMVARHVRRAFIVGYGHPAYSANSRPIQAPPWPGRYLRYPPLMKGNDVHRWQDQMHNRGWTISVDSTYGPQSKGICTQFQKEKGLQADGIVGPGTWRATWEAPIT